MRCASAISPTRMDASHGSSIDCCGSCDVSTGNHSIPWSRRCVDRSAACATRHAWLVSRGPCSNGATSTHRTVPMSSRQHGGRSFSRVARCGRRCLVMLCCHLPMPHRRSGATPASCSGTCMTIDLVRADCDACRLEMAARFWLATTSSWPVVCCAMPRVWSSSPVVGGAMCFER